jgi:hypothetical protein
MSKDKGSKNKKKSPADKSGGKTKTLSAYKSEGKNSFSKSPVIEVFTPKSNSKEGNSKSKKG